MSSYYLIDHPVLLRYLFYPRNDYTDCPAGAFDLNVPVEKDIFISYRFYKGDDTYPWLLYFHGNGEVVSDYDEIARIYNQKGLNLVVADYRGYGASTGEPTFAAMIEDAHELFKAITGEIAERGFNEELWVMGRSLGSVSALELACSYQDRIRGLIIESGFLNAARLIKDLGLLDESSLELLDRECLDKARKIMAKSLVIHGEYDHIVPVEEAYDLFEYLGAEDKDLVIIPDADHNNIMYVGFEQYFEAIKKFTQ